MPVNIHKEDRPPADEKLADRDMVLDLNFVPSWARKPSAEVRYVLPSERPRDRRRERPSREKRSRSPRGREAFEGRRSRGTESVRRVPARQPEPTERSAFYARFFPEQRALSQVVRKLRASRRFYPLMDIASLFLAQPDACFVRLEPETATDGQLLYQCRSCSMAALSRDTIMAHLLKHHFEESFDVEETECEPPAGKFVCVARCGLSGVLLGPPNHNAYQEKLREVHFSRFPDMPSAEYETHVEMIHDPGLIEQWKEESRKQQRYLPKHEKDGGSLTALQAKTLYTEKIAPTLIASVRTVSLPSKVARRTEDPVLMRVLSEGWQRENRFPRSLLFALRGAFRHRGLYLFKAGKEIVFVGSTEPCPLDTTHVVESIQEVLVYLREHPGCTRRQLFESLRPGAAPDSEEAVNVLSPLSWLIEKGHIIEFFDGTLAVPMGGSRRVSQEGSQKTRKRSR